jgi:hypothetical protein
VPNYIAAIKHSLQFILSLAKNTLVRLARYLAMYGALIKFLFSYFFFSYSAVGHSQFASKSLSINDSGYFETRGLNVLVFSNRYGLFGDEKASGVEIIHHGIRTATNGDVRLNPTPEQWDSIPQFIKKEVNKNNNTIEAFLRYPSYNFNYTIKTEAKNEGIVLTVNLETPLPKELDGKAGFNLEFLPTAYFHKSFLMDGKSGIFPLYPSSAMSVNKSAAIEPLPLATGKSLVLAVEDAARRVTIKINQGLLSVFDSRNKAQNGWFVARSLIPSNKTGKVIEWFITASTIANWTREPIIEYSQVGYHLSQKKVAVTINTK